MSNSSNSQFHKTKLCRYFQSSRCHKGEDCSYAHTRDELVDKPNLIKTSLCHVWMKTSQCSMETECPYAHGRDKLRPHPSPRVCCESSSTSPNLSRMQDSPIRCASPPCGKRIPFPRRSSTTDTRCSIGDVCDDSSAPNSPPCIKVSSPHTKSARNNRRRRRRCVTLAPFQGSFLDDNPFLVYPPSFSAISDVGGFWSRPSVPPYFYYPSYLEDFSSTDGSIDATPKSLIEFPIIF